jgi:hypothetical protein
MNHHAHYHEDDEVLCAISSIDTAVLLNYSESCRAPDEEITRT